MSLATLGISSNFQSLLARYVLHDEFVLAIQSQAGYVCSDGESDLVQAFWLLLTGDSNGATPAMRAIANDLGRDESERGQAALMCWVGDFGEDRFVARDGPLAATLFQQGLDTSRDGEADCKRLKAAIEELSNRGVEQEYRDRLRLCYGMLSYQLGNGASEVAKKWAENARTSLSFVANNAQDDYLCGRAWTLLAADHQRTRYRTKLAERSERAITEAKQLLFLNPAKRRKQLDIATQSETVSPPNMDTVEGATAEIESAPDDWATIRRGLATLPEEHLDEAEVVLATRREEIDRQKKFQVAVDMSRALFPELAEKERVTDQDLTDQFAKASKRDPSEFKGEKKKLPYVELVRAFRDADGTVELDGVLVRLGFVRPKGASERTFDVQLPVKGRKSPKTFWVPPPLIFRFP